MYLKKIYLSNFKNIRKASIEFSPKVNCINGNNGEGKTNLLDAIYYLSMTKSYFFPSDKFTITHGENECVLNGLFASENGSSDKVSILLRNGESKQVKKGEKCYSRLSDHIGVYPIVMVSPSDTSLINDSGEERRRFMNYILSQIDRRYLKTIQAYNQILAQRNRLLKNEVISDDLLDSLSMQLNNYAAYIYSKRSELCKELKSLTERHYELISGGKESIEINYVSDLDTDSLDNLLRREAYKDRLLKYTTVGVQRDDIIFEMEGYPIKKCGSQGQQKSFLLALKLAQFSLMKEIGRAHV